MPEGKPTRGASRRFENLTGMMPVEISVPSRTDADGEPDGGSIEGTVVDISPGCLCVRVSIDQKGAERMQALVDGDYVEARIVQSSQLRWTILGHLAWVWAPSMEGTDTVGSLGIDIAGVIEENTGWLGKLRSIFSREQTIDVEKSSRTCEPPSKARRRKETS